MTVKELLHHTNFVEAIYLHLHKSLRLRNDLLVRPSILFMPLNREISLNVNSPLFFLKIVESRGGRRGEGGGAEVGRQEKYFSSPTPTPLVELILFSRLNSAHPFDTKKVRVTVSKV